MKLAIVDDLKTDSDRLAGFVHTYMEQHQLKLDALDQFESGESFLSGFTSGSYDLIFLDIYMTGITGMETAKRSGRSITTAASSSSRPPRNLPWKATM